jgi:PAS domain S-box-containing protein
MFTELQQSHPLEGTLLGVAQASLQLVRYQDFDKTVAAVVEIMGKSAEVDRCYIFKNSYEAGTPRMNQLVEWASEGVSIQIENQELLGLPYDIEPTLFDTLSSGKAFHGAVADCSEPFKSILAAQEIQSFLFLPILSNNQLWGFIGYDACREVRQWEAAEISALQTLANAFGFFIENLELRTELEEKNKQFDLALKGSKDGIWDINLVTNRTYVSDRWKEMFGFEHATFHWTYENWLDLVHPDDKERVDQNLSQFMTTGQGTNDLEYRMRHGDGHYLWILSRSAVELDANGQPVRIGGSDTDITERKIHEQVLAENERQYRNLVNNLREVVFESDAQGYITFLNQSWEQLTGYTVAESLGKPGQSFLAPSSLPSVQPTLEKMNRSPHVYTRVELQYQHKTGKVVWAEVKTKRIIGANGEPVGSTGTIVDITERKKAEADTARAIEKEKELMELRSRFILMASHEFRTPLATIQSSLDILRIYLQSADDRLRLMCEKHFEKMGTEIHRVGDLMNDILLLGKMQAGKTKLQLKPIYLNELILNLLAHHYSNGPDPRIPSFKQLGKPKPAAMDEQLISHCLMNLLSNALKFSVGKPAPEITLQFRRNKIEIAVRDYGIGIHSSDKKRVFEPFFRGSNVDQTPGTGLGLVVVKEFIDLHGGKIHFNSHRLGGTTFILELPL